MFFRCTTSHQVSNTNSLSHSCHDNQVYEISVIVKITWLIFFAVQFAIWTFFNHIKPLTGNKRRLTRLTGTFWSSQSVKISYIKRKSKKFGTTNLELTKNGWYEESLRFLVFDCFAFCIHFASVTIKHLEIKLNNWKIPSCSSNSALLAPTGRRITQGV